MTTSTRIALLDDYQDVGHRLGDWSAIPGADVVPFREHIADSSALVAALQGFNVVVAMRERTKLDAGVLDALPHLRLVVTTGMSNAAIDVEAARRAGVVVCGTGGFLTPTSELTWGLILAIARHIPQEDRAVRRGGWQHAVGTGLAGRTLGLLSLGRVGGLVAEVGRAFRMDVIAWSENLTASRCDEVGAELVSKNELFERSDVLSVHLVLSERTRRLVGHRELSAMKRSALIVNTSRGPIVEEGALVHALENGTIAAAGLDVFDDEPLPQDHPLRRLPNTVVLPHIGYVTDDLYELFWQEIVDDVACFLDGEPVRVIAPGR